MAISGVIVLSVLSCHWVLRPLFENGWSFRLFPDTLQPAKRASCRWFLSYGPFLYHTMAIQRHLTLKDAAGSRRSRNFWVAIKTPNPAFQPWFLARSTSPLT